MENGYIQYSEIKRLLWKYNINFKSNEEYENYVKDLIRILKI